MSYIVKNCPAYEYDEEWDHHICKRNLVVYETTCDTCPECSDCTMKQIVEKCKNYKEDCKIEGNCLDERLCSTCFLGGANELGEWILDDLDIQEVE
jgi:hypothetical protein